MMIWDRFQRGSKKTSISESFTSALRPLSRSLRGASDSSHDSGYASLGSPSEHHDDKGSRTSTSLTSLGEATAMSFEEKLESESISEEGQAQSELETGMDLSTKTTESTVAELPISIETQRVARGITCNFRRSFGNQLARHLNAQTSTIASPTTHAIAIFPTVSWRKGFVNVQVAVEIIIQCHPLAEGHVQQFLRERRAAIETFLRFARAQRNDWGSNSLWVDIRVVGREITFLSRFGASVYTSPSKTSHLQQLEPSGKLLTIDVGSGKTAQSTLGGLISVTSHPRSGSAWFGITTSHGLHMQSQQEEDSGLSSSLLSLVMHALGSLSQRMAERIFSSTGEEAGEAKEILRLLQGCYRAITEFTKSELLQRNGMYDLQEQKIRRLSNLRYWLQTARQLPYSEQRRYLLDFIDCLLSTRSDEPSDGKSNMKREEEFQSRSLGERMGYMSLTSTEMFTASESDDTATENFDLCSDVDHLDEGNLDWALLDPVHARPESYPFSKYLNDVFEPSDPSADIEDTPKVILVNENRGYPEAEMCPQVAFVSFPPSISLVEVLTFKLKGSGGSSANSKPSKLSSGDSGSWLISMDAAGGKVVHGQLVAVNCLGEGLLIPMASIVCDVTAVLLPIFDSSGLHVKTHVPLDAVNLPDMSDFVREWLIPRMNREGQLLAWKFMRIGVDAAIVGWKKAVREAAFRTFSDHYATHRWTLEERECERDLRSLNGQLEIWEDSQRMDSLISNQWVNHWLERRQYWYDRAFYWRKYLEVPSGGPPGEISDVHSYHAR